MSVIGEVMSQISTDWAALTPPNRTTVPYVEVVGLAPLSGTWRDRGFSWDIPVVDGDLVGVSGSTYMVPWRIAAVLWVGMAGRGWDQIADAVAEESRQLIGAVYKRGSWPAGVVAPPHNVVHEVEPTAEAVLVTLQFDVVTSESL